MFTSYKNFGGGSGIIAYRIGDDFIEVKFSDGAIYQYTQSSAGVSTILMMKRLAMQGVGLNSYINTQARKSYSSKR